MNGLTPNELRLVEEYVWVLDFLSRCALGLDRGDWFYLYDKAGELQRAAGQLAEVAHEAVAYHGRHYRAGRLLHPAKPRERR
jgi:hypothetical protein